LKIRNLKVTASNETTKLFKNAKLVLVKNRIFNIN